MAEDYKGFNTKCVHSGTYIDPEHGGVNTPIHTSTANLIKNEEVLYPRYLNTPGFKSVSAKIADLEKAAYGFVCASGMAAISTALFSFLKAGDHLLLQSNVYGGTYHFVERELQGYGIEVSIVDSLEPDDFKPYIKENTKVIYIETPSNPLLKVVDINAFAQLAKEHGLISMIDNTFATPILQNPISLGIDVVLHSGTKYLSGHSDILCGAIVTDNSDYAENIAFHLINHGGMLDSQALYLLERSLKTLALRMERHCLNAMKIAEYLEAHKAVKKVNYPGLTNYPAYDIARKQMHGFGGMLSFELEGKYEDAFKFIQDLEIICETGSLGGVESLISMPCTVSHKKMKAEEREAIGISDTLIRLSVGIEDLEDLIADIEQALSKVSSAQLTS